MNEKLKKDTNKSKKIESDKKKSDRNINKFAKERLVRQERTDKKAVEKKLDEKNSREKAYKLLSMQLKISNGEAKKMIDAGLVSISGRRVNIARAEVPLSTKFSVREVEQPKKIFEDDNILVINKPSMITSDEVEELLKRGGNEIFLLNRLDRETSGILLLGKNIEFQKKVIEEFKAHRVYKEYVAWINGKIAEPMTIDKKLKKVSNEGRGKVVIAKDGVDAKTEIEPIAIYGNKTKLKIVIDTGRTHQIRVHLSSIGFPIIGDISYGGNEYERILLHSKKVKLFDYSFEVEEPKSFDRFLNLNS